MAATEQVPLKIIRARALVALLGISRGQIQRLRTLDPDFPAPMRLGIGRRCALGWYEGEIRAWLDSRSRATLPELTSRAVLPGQIDRSVS